MIEIIGASLENSILENSILTITAIDCSEEHLQWMERRRDYESAEREIEYQFNLHDFKTFSYIRSWLKRQAVVKRLPADRTWKDVIHAIIGTVVEPPQGCYRIWELG